MSRSDVTYLTAPSVVLPNTNARQLPEVKFGVPASEALKDDHLPIPLVDMLVYIAQEGVTTTDLFRKPGNPSDTKVIMKKLTEGKELTFTNYNFYTLASVIKKFLIKLPGGVFGPEVERRFLSVLDIPQRVEQYEELNRIILSLPPATQQLMSLLFGTWFRIVNHSEYNTMSSEAVAKSVAGSLFHTCSDDPKKVQKAVEVLQILIDDFGVSNMFGRRNIQYFAEMTRTGIRVNERYRFEYRYPTEGSVPYEKSVGILTEVLQREAKKRGFDVKENAISEEDFYGRPPRSRAGTGETVDRTMEMRLGAGPPSPQSLQPQTLYGDETDDGSNPHKKLTHTSSLSAPEVNRGNSPTQDHLTVKQIYQSSSLSRFDYVRRRQIIRMKKRSNWFLAPNMSATSADSHSSFLGSRDRSVGRSSFDGTSSDALMSDVTDRSDGGMSDTHYSEGMRLFTDVDTSCLDTSHDQSMTGSELAASTPNSRGGNPRSKLQPPDFINGNHSASGTSPSLTPSPRPSTPSHTSITEKDVRCFMVENWYGSPASQGSHS